MRSGEGSSKKRRERAFPVMNSTPNSSAACWCAVPARPRRRHALVLSKFPKKSKGSPTKGLYGRGQQLLVEMGPPSFVAITHLPLSKFPRYSQCRLSFVCIMPHQCDPAYSRHHSPLLALPSAPESGRANPNHALQLNPGILYTTRTHIALASPLLMYVLWTALHPLVRTAHDSTKSNRARQRPHMSTLAPTDVHAFYVPSSHSALRAFSWRRSRRTRTSAAAPPPPILHRG